MILCVIVFIFVDFLLVSLVLVMFNVCWWCICIMDVKFLLIFLVIGIDFMLFIFFIIDMCMVLEVLGVVFLFVWVCKVKGLSSVVRVSSVILYCL